MSDTSGFYKLDPDKNGVFYAPNFVINVGFELHAASHDTYTYPVDGWFWFDTAEDAYLSFGVDPSMTSKYITLFTTDALLASGESVESEWFDFQTLQINTLHVVHTRASGTYSFEVDWSIDGVMVDVTEVIQGAGSNNTSVSKTVATRYGRVRVRNIDDTTFTMHRTVVTGGMK